MHQQGLDGVAGGRVLRLAVDGHPQRLGHIGRCIDIEMADAIGMAQHWNPGVVLDETDQLIAAARNDQIHQPIEAQQRQALLAGGEQRQGISRHGTAAQPVLQSLHHGLVGTARLAAAFEDGTVS